MSQHQVAGPFVFLLDWHAILKSARKHSPERSFHSIQLILRLAKLLLLLFTGWRLPTRMQSLLTFPLLQKIPTFIKGKFSYQPLSVSLWHFLFIFQNPCLTHCLLLFQITVDSASQAFHLATSTIQRVDWWKRPKCPKSISQTLLVFSRVMSMDCAMYKNMMNWNWKL